MIDQISITDVLNSVLIRLRVRYAFLVREEKKKEYPNEQKIEAYTYRRKEINDVSRTIFFQSSEIQEAAIEKFALELKELN